MKLKEILKIMYSVILGVILTMMTFVTDGQHFLIEKYVILHILITLLISINTILLLKEKSNVFQWISIITVVCIIPLSTRALLIYTIININYLIFFHFKKQKVFFAINIIILLLILLIANRLHENGQEQNKQDRNIISSKKEFGFSPEREYYLICSTIEETVNNEVEQTNRIIIRNSMPFIAILDSFSAELGDSVAVENCDKSKFQWLDTDTFEIENIKYNIKNIVK